MADSPLVILAKAISSTASPKIRAYAIAQAKESGLHDAAIKKLIEEVEVLKGGSTTVTRPGPADPPVTPPIPPIDPPVDPPPGLTLGGTLAIVAPRIAQSSGAVVNVATPAALASAFGTASNGSTINITSNLNGAGATLTITRNASSGGPITITRDPGVTITNYAHWDVRGSYLRFQGLDIGSGTIDGIKFNVTADHCELDGCTIHDNVPTPPQFGSGILLTSSAQNIHIWNNVIYTNGSTGNGNKDHGLYWGYALGACVIANNLVYNNCAYNLQLYPDCPGLYVVGNTIDGGQIHASQRGGIVVGSETGLTDNCTFVGNIITNAPSNGMAPYDPASGDTNNLVYDSIAFGNGSTDFATGGGLNYTNCIHADPLYNNRAAHDYRPKVGSPSFSLVQAARYGLLPATYRDGSTRQLANAGSEPPA